MPTQQHRLRTALIKPQIRSRIECWKRSASCMTASPFVKVATNPYTTQDGAGLGLAIVKSLVNSHGGRLDIQSDIGKGTTVRITLPHPVT